MDTELPTGTAVTAPWPTDLKTVFGKPDGAAAIIARVRADALEAVKGLTVATKQERDAIASAAYAVAKRKTALDDAGKALNDELRVSINAVDAERRQLRDGLDAIRDETRAPLTKYESDEKDRVKALQDRVDRLAQAQDMLPENPSAEQVAALIVSVECVAIDDTWAEFVGQAATAKDRTLATLRNWHVIAKRREADAAELERLRAEAAARAESDRVRIAAEKAESDRIAADSAERERAARIERDAREREARAAADVEARAKADADRAAKESAEREAAQIRAALDAQNRHAQELAEAEQRVEIASQRERDRLAAEQRAATEAQAMREADTGLRAKVRGEIVEALSAKLLSEANLRPGGLTLLIIADLLMTGEIPHVKVVF